jgi:hypothetical protein
MQQVIRVNKLTERAKELEVLKQREYFEAQKRANLYLLKKVGNVYFAGKPYRVGKILEIPVYYDFGASGKKQVGTFSTDLETYELIPSKSDSPENIWGNTDAASKEATPFLTS